MVLIILMHLLYGCTFTISKILIGHASPMLVIGIRMTIAGLLLLLYAQLFIKHKAAFDRSAWINIAQMGFFGIYLPYVLRYWALQSLTVIKTSLFFNVAPFGSFLFSYLLLGEKSTWKKWLGLFVGFSGILPMLIFKSELEPMAFGIFSLPELAMLAAILSTSYGWVVLKKLVMHTDAKPVQINGITMGIGGTLALFNALGFESNLSISNASTFFAWLALIILITNVICYNLYGHLLKTHSATLLSLAGLLAPVSAAITSWLYFGEKVTWDCYLSGLMVLIGFCIFYSEEIRLRKASPQSQNIADVDGELVE